MHSFASATATTSQRRAFVVRVAELLHIHGTPAHRLENLLRRLCDRLDLVANTFTTPTVIHVAFEGEAGPESFLRRVQPGRPDLGKLVVFDEILDAHEAGQLSLSEAREALDRAAAAGPRYGRSTITLAYGAASASAAVLFGGGLGEVLASLAIGMLLGALSLVVLPRAETPRLFEVVAAFGAALAAAALVVPFPDLASNVVVLAGLVVLLPGLTLTVAMTELATRHLSSGTARMAGALTGLLALTLGVALGRTVAAGFLPTGPTLVASPLPPLAGAPIVALAPVAIAVLHRARTREFGWIFAATMVALVSARIGAVFLGTQLGPFLGALALGLFANGFARTRRRPASVLLTPGLIALVPGSLGYRSLDLFVAQDPMAGVATAFDTSLIAIALVGGMLIANVVLPPRRSL